jgi:hypothetical protein
MQSIGVAFPSHSARQSHGKINSTGEELQDSLRFPSDHRGSASRTSESNIDCTVGHLDRDRFAPGAQLDIERRIFWPSVHQYEL